MAPGGFYKGMSRKSFLRRLEKGTA
jgi:hypothetical protein